MKRQRSKAELFKKGQRSKKPVPLGVGGTFHIIHLKGAVCEVGPVLNKDTWGRVFVEILTSSQNYRGLTYHKGGFAWVVADRVTWHTRSIGISS